MTTFYLEFDNAIFPTVKDLKADTSYFSFLLDVPNAEGLAAKKKIPLWLMFSARIALQVEADKVVSVVKNCGNDLTGKYGAEFLAQQPVIDFAEVFTRPCRDTVLLSADYIHKKTVGRVDYYFVVNADLETVKSLTDAADGIGLTQIIEDTDTQNENTLCWIVSDSVESVVVNNNYHVWFEAIPYTSKALKPTIPTGIGGEKNVDS